MPCQYQWYVATKSITIFNAINHAKWLTLDLSFTFVASMSRIIISSKSLARVIHSSQYKQLWAGKLVGARKYD